MTLLRSIAIILLTLVFAVATTGISVVYHYCAGEPSGATLFAGAGCGCGAEEMPKGCCTDSVTLHKVGDTFMADAVAPVCVPLLHAVLPILFLSVPPVPVTLCDTSIADGSPPPRVGLHVVHCALLI